MNFYEQDPIKKQLSESLQHILKNELECGDDVFDQLFKLMERPPEIHLGDYALPCFALTKALRKKPDLIATSLKEGLLKQCPSVVARVETVGAFLNIFLDRKILAQEFLPTVLQGSFFDVLSKNSAHQRERVMIEFSQPNTHKEFHVGHARNVCLGDALCRLYRYNGFQVIAANYIGDEGTHVAKCLWRVDEKFKKEGASLPTTKAAEWYGQCYVEATTKLAEASESERQTYNLEISKILGSLEAKSGEFFTLWKKTARDCMEDFEKTYAWFDVAFDHIFFESDVSEECQAIVDEGIKKGLFVESQGAIGLDLSEHKLGFFLARKSDGSSLYITKDLALAKRKFEDFDIQRSIYVVGNEQNLHFQQLFKVLDLMGFPHAKNCYHLSYAHVKLPEGKMSSRKGNTVTFAQLIRIITDELETVLKKYEDTWSPEEIKDTTHKLAIAAIKYGMSSMDPHKEIVFDPKQWTSFDGNSGPYLLYSFARATSILEKSGVEISSLSQQNFQLLDDPSEGELVRVLYDFNSTVLSACLNYKPSTLANYLFDLCKTFNRFYAQVKILSSENADQKAARLALAQSFLKILEHGLYLLGIPTVKRM